MFSAASITVNRGCRRRIGAEVGVVLDAVLIVIQFGLGTAIFVHSLTRRCVWTNHIKVVDDAVAVVVLNVDDSTSHAVCSVQNADLFGTYVTLKARWIVAKPVAVPVSGLRWFVGEGVAELVDSQTGIRVNVVHVGVGVAVAISVRAAKGRN